MSVYPPNTIDEKISRDSNNLCLHLKEQVGMLEAVLKKGFLSSLASFLEKLGRKGIVLDKTSSYVLVNPDLIDYETKEVKKYGKIVACSNSLRELLGFSGDDLIGRPWSELISREKRTKEYLDKFRSPWDQDFSFEVFNGGEREIRVHAKKYPFYERDARRKKIIHLGSLVLVESISD
jgi:PAS domain-containing protein